VFLLQDLLDYRLEVVGVFLVQSLVDTDQELTHEVVTVSAHLVLDEAGSLVVSPGLLGVVEVLGVRVVRVLELEVLGLRLGRAVLALAASEAIKRHCWK